MSTAIEFNHVGKQYRLGVVSTGTIAHDLNRWWQTSVLRREDPYLKIGSVNDRAAKADSEYVWALRDIDFKVEQGDVVGIIGKNGAGKSTLLKLLSKVTAPTMGSIRARGRIASLLEVGTGFHQEMTGRENIYMNGAILGMTKQEISRKLDEIIDFSGCERYIDTPVKRYSSGMMVRLGFAVAAHLDPEILVVDEVLAVGDAEFQKKAIGKMQSVSQGDGRTVLFVSHNMASIRALCKKGIVLEKGLVAFEGTIHDAVTKYVSMSETSVDGKSTIQVRILNNALKIYEVLINDRTCGNLTFVGNLPKEIRICLKGYLAVGMNLSSEIMLFDSKGILLGSYSPTHWYGTIHNCPAGNFELEEFLTLPKMLTSGEYHLSMRLSQLNVEHVAEIESLANITIEQFASPITGNVFNQSYTGSFVL